MDMYATCLQPNEWPTIQHKYYYIIYAHTVTTYDSQLLNSAANKFLPQQPTCRLAVGAEYGPDTNQ
jgi:hypothetical protein